MDRRPALICKPSLCLTFVCKLPGAGRGWTVLKDTFGNGTGGVRQCSRIYVIMEQVGVRQCLRIYVVIEQVGVN